MSVDQSLFCSIHNFLTLVKYSYYWSIERWLKATFTWFLSIDPHIVILKMLVKDESFNNKEI